MPQFERAASISTDCVTLSVSGLPICYRLVAGIHHGAVGLDITDDLPVIVADLQAPPVARIVDVPEVLVVLIRDGPS